MRRSTDIDIPSFLHGSSDETTYPLITTDRSFASDSSGSLTHNSVNLVSSSDYLKFPANLSISKQRARKHKIRDKKQYGLKGHLPLLIDKEEFLKYSMSSYFYFDFIEQGICILLITFLFCGLFDLVTIMAYPPDESNPNADLSFVYHLSTLNLNYFPSVLTVKLSLSIINIIVVKVYSISKEKARIRKYLKQKNPSQNYFSVLVQGLPQPLDLKNFYEFMSPHLGGNSDEKIKKVIVLQDNQEKQRLLKLRGDIYVKSLSIESVELKRKYTQEIQKIDNEILNEDNKLAANQRYNGSLIITLEDTYTTLQLLKRWRKLSVPKILLAKFLRYFGDEYLKEYEFQGKFISIEKAGEPFDVIWQNTGKSQFDIFFRSLFASIMLWGAVLVYPLINIIVTNNEKSKISTTTENDLLSHVWEYTPFIIMILSINLAIILLINFMSIFLGLRRKTDVEKRKIGMKVAFSFINYSLLISAKAFLDSTIVKNDVNEESTKESLINTISLLMFYLIFLPQVFEILDIEYIYKYLRRKYYLRKNNFSTLSQGELDEIVKPPYFDFSTRVSNVAQIVFLALVSAPIFPTAPLLAIAALLSASFIDRYLILRRCSNWKLVGTTLGMSFSNTYNYNLVVQIIGNILFLIFSEPQSGTPTQYLLIFVMGLGYVFCVTNYLSPIVVKHAYNDLKIQNMNCETEERKFKIMYEDLYQDYLMNGR